MKNSSQATNEPKYKIGDEIVIISSSSDLLAFSKLHQIVEIPFGKLEDGQLFFFYRVKGYDYDFAEEDCITKEQALLAFQEWLGKE